MKAVPISIQQEQAHQDEDSVLVKRFNEGDAEAFNRIVFKYRQQVYAVARRFTKNHEESDDLTQETFVKAYQNLASFRGDASLKTWLLRITTNLSINMVKSGRISKDSGEAAEDHTPSRQGQALEGILHQERRGQLQQAISQLPPKQQRTLLLKTYQDLTCEEVSNIMGCSVGTVKANIFNAMKKLKLMMNSGASA